MKKKVLIIDDTPENIDFLVGILKNSYKLVAARNGEKALKIVNSDNPPDLILLDIMMPEMDGLEVCRRLKETDRNENIPILFITGKTDDKNINDGFEAGGDDFITKPFNYQLVQARVAAYLELSMLRKQTSRK